ncbi:MAG TPA: ABC transporter permease subunit [Spirochaetia bacterium]|nr:ABC transporter permease subunit [Spirochaetia bacterium]
MRLRLDPLTWERFRRFRSIHRAWISLWILVALVGLSLVAELLVNSRAILVVYKGRPYLPTYDRVRFGDEFGLGYHYEANYRELARKLAQDGTGWVLLPPIPYNPYEQEFRQGSYPPYAPSWAGRHLLGTDRIGRDVLARLFYGFRIAIFFSLAFVLLTFLAGTLLGILMGYIGGRFDIVVQRLIEIWEQVPFLYVVMIVVSIFQPEFLLFLGIFVLFGWTSRTWAVRAMTYRERERDYVQAARTMGASRWRIVAVHILPNILVVVLTSLPFAVEGAISSLTALDYLGFGLRPPTPSWGELISQGVSVYQQAPWIIASVGGAMTFVLVLIAFVGEGLRDAFDPRRYTVYE